jgi:hypothetical protein
MEMINIIDRVRTDLRLSGLDYPLDEVVGLCPGLTWNQVCVAIDYLSRTGEVELRLEEGRVHRVHTHPPSP